MTDAQTQGLRWGILATGLIARMFATDLRSAGLDLRAVGSRSLESASEFAVEFSVPRVHESYESLVADDEVDIVYVASPHPMHAEHALLAIAHGKHVLVEKPFTLNAGEAKQVADAARDAGVLAMEAMWTRYLPHMRRIHEIIAAGTLGEIRAVTADHTQLLPSDPSHRLNALELGGGALLDLGIYPISFVWDILGAPTAIHAVARLGDTGADTEVATLFTHDSGAVSTTLSSSRAAGPDTASIIGTKARIDIDRVWYTPTSFRLVSPDGEVLESHDEKPEGRGMQFQAYAAEAAVRSGRLDTDELPLAESVAIMRTLDEIRRQIGVSYPQEG